MLTFWMLWTIVSLLWVNCILQRGTCRRVHFVCAWHSLIFFIAACWKADTFERSNTVQQGLYRQFWVGWYFCLKSHLNRGSAGLILRPCRLLNILATNIGTTRCLCEWLIFRERQSAVLSATFLVGMAIIFTLGGISFFLELEPHEQFNNTNGPELFSLHVS